MRWIPKDQLGCYHNNPEKEQWLDQHSGVESKTGLLDGPTVGYERKRSVKNDDQFCFVVLFGFVLVTSTDEEPCGRNRLVECQ